MRKRTSGAACLFAGLVTGVVGVACTGIIGGDDRDPRSTTDPNDEAANAPEVVAVAGLRRLTVDEYDNTIRDLVGDDTRPSRARLPPDSRAPFDNDYTTQLVSPALVEGVELVATEVAARLLKDKPRRDRVVGCVPAGPADEACLRDFVMRFGRRALRHPLSDGEVQRYMKARESAIAEGDFYAGIDVALRAFLQDPQFLYRVEIGTPIPARPGLFRLTDWEVATRLSFFLWGSTPDDRLLDRVAAGELHTPEHRKNAARDLLADARARAVVTRFHAMWLGYEQTPSVTAAMHAETGALLGRVVFDEKRSWQDIFRATDTWVPDTLAKSYGLPAHGSEDPAWTSYAGTERRGILSHGSFLSLGARGEDTSPTLRGKAVRKRLLCGTVLPPPPGVKIDEPPPKTAEAPCKRDRYQQHAENSACKGCHAQIDPIGFGLERYDARGRYRTKDDGPDGDACPIDGNGVVAESGAFHGPGELGDALLRAGMSACLVKQMYRFANGRTTLDATDDSIVQSLVKDRAGEFKLDDVLVDIVANPGFGYRKNDP